MSDDLALLFVVFGGWQLVMGNKKWQWVILSAGSWKRGVFSGEAAGASRRIGRTSCAAMMSHNALSFG
jgi:hypothetical protein